MGSMELGIVDTRSRMEDYEGIERIGRGSFGAAFLMLNKNDNKKYVLKKIRLSKMTEDFKCTANQEVNLIGKLHHPHILEYKDAWVEKGNCICIVIDYCEGGNISEKIRKTRGSYFSEEKLCKWLTQMLLAIDYLHTNRILHRNIKLSNILVTKENNILLGDYGLGKILDEGGFTSTAVGTLNYMCPEQLENASYCYKSDMWSLGCCIFEIAAHQQAFKAPDMAGLINKINRSLLSPFPYMYSSTLKQIIKSMLRKSPEHRPTAAELLRHPHLKPFLLRCRNLPTVFLPVKSPSPNSTKEKTSNTSLSNISEGVKDHRESEMKPKPKELLPLFEENTDIEYLNLLDSDVLIEDKHETKRVDPTSCFGNVPHDSKDSKSRSADYKTPACNGDHREICDSSLQNASMLLSTALSERPEGNVPSKLVSDLKESNMESDKIMETATLCNPPDKERETEEEDAILRKCTILMHGIVSGDTVVSVFEEVANLTEKTVRSKVDAQPRSPISEKEVTGACSGVIAVCEIDEDMAEIKEDGSRNPTLADKGDGRVIDQSSDGSLSSTIAAIGSDGNKIEWMNRGNLRADVLESLLELCARLLKQDKLDELTGVLKAFGDETVSSRETAIWLTKSLINVQNLAKQS